MSPASPLNLPFAAHDRFDLWNVFGPRPVVQVDALQQLEWRAGSLSRTQKHALGFRIGIGTHRQHFDAAKTALQRGKQFRQFRRPVDHSQGRATREAIRKRCDPRIKR
ncbi:MAG: hypothetical protein ABL932_15125, partial [Terricaulis sp.]